MKYINSLQRFLLINKFSKFIRKIKLIFKLMLSNKIIFLDEADKINKPYRNSEKQINL